MSDKTKIAEAKELRKKWVEALRSGKYNQAIGRLKTRTSQGLGHCCLGVLCDIVDPGAWYEYDGSHMWGAEEDDEYLPKMVADKAMVGKIGNLWKPVVLDEVEYDDLIAINDAGYNFKQIADIIEAGHCDLKEVRDD